MKDTQRWVLHADMPGILKLSDIGAAPMLGGDYWWNFEAFWTRLGATR